MFRLTDQSLAQIAMHQEEDHKVTGILLTHTQQTSSFHAVVLDSTHPKLEQVLLSRMELTVYKKCKWQMAHAF